MPSVKHLVCGFMVVTARHPIQDERRRIHHLTSSHLYPFVDCRHAPGWQVRRLKKNILKNLPPKQRTLVDVRVEDDGARQALHDGRWLLFAGLKFELRRGGVLRQRLFP